MPLTLTKRIVYGMFAQVILLLALASVFALLAGIKFLPGDALATTITFVQANAAANLCLWLALLTGLLAGGIYRVASARSDGALTQEMWLYRAYQGWTIVLILGVVAAIFGQTEGRYGLELPYILDIFVLILMLVMVALVAMSIDSSAGVEWDGITLVWSVGMLLFAAGIGVGLIAPANPLQERVLHVLAVQGGFHVGGVLAVVALGFWLMTRFSSVPYQWAEEGAFHVGGMLAIAGVLVGMAQLSHLPGAFGSISSFAVILAPLFYMIFAAHSYRALSNRQPSSTLSAHWLTLGIVLLFMGIGVLGGMLALPGIQSATQGTQLTALQQMLVMWGMIAVILGGMNQAVAEMRGHNARITGLLPFWLIAAGTVGGAIALLAVGVAQVYLERLLNIGYLDAQNALTPLYALWLVCLLLLAPGIAIYALGFRARRLMESDGV